MAEEEFAEYLLWVAAAEAAARARRSHRPRAEPLEEFIPSEPVLAAT